MKKIKPPVEDGNVEHSSKIRKSSRIRQNENKITGNGSATISEPKVTKKLTKNRSKTNISAPNEKKSVLDFFTEEEQKLFPDGWIWKKDRSKFEGKLLNNNDSEIIGKIVLVPPDVWGWTEKSNFSEYWKNETYDKSLHSMSIEQMKNEILLIGKIIKLKSKTMYDVLFLCDSDPEALCAFTTKQCLSLMIDKPSGRKVQFESLTNSDNIESNNNSIQDSTRKQSVTKKSVPIKKVPATKHKPPSKGGRPPKKNNRQKEPNKTTGLFSLPRGCL